MADLCVEQRPHSEPITRQEERPLPRVPNGKCKLAIETLEAVRAKFLERVHDDFRVALGGEAVPAGFQFRTQLEVVENLAVEDDPEGAVLVGDRLLAGAEINNAEPGVAQAGKAVEINAELVRPAMTNHRQHPADALLLNRVSVGKVDYACNATHQTRAFLLILPEPVLGSSVRNSTCFGTM